MKLCKRTYIVVCMIIIWFSPLTFNNHVVQDHTTVHHLPHLRFRSSKSWVPDNDKTRLKHTKCPLYILPSCLLTLCKPRLLLRSWSKNCLHKSCPRRIDTVGEVIPFGIGFSEVNQRILSLGQSCEHRRSLQYIDVIVCSHHSEERMPNPQVMISNSFKDHTAFPIAAFVQPLPSKRAILLSPMHAIDATKHT
jgi:hypothetical protein